MKCREFQFGDWCCNEYGLPMQMVDLGKDYAYATYEGDEGYPWLFSDNKDDQPEPIEITDEMFSKNNWEECDYPLPYNHHEYYYVKDEGGNHLVWNSEVLSIWLDWEEGKDDGAYANIAMPIKYVHQLQHILRLAGMTELANNFKI